MTFSIIIPVYNVAPYLHECLDSVCAAVEKVERLNGFKVEKSDGGVEVICVDDGSTDESGAILDEYAARFNPSTLKPFDFETLKPFSLSTFRVIHRQNAGVGAARNRGLELASGEWIGFVDGDDIVRADWLELCRRKASEFPDVDMVRYGVIAFDDGESCRWPADAGQDGRRVLDLRRRFSEEAWTGDFFGRLYRRSKVADVRFPTYPIGEDCAWKVDAILRMDSLVDVGACLYGYRQRASSAVHTDRIPEWVRESLEWRVHVLQALSDAGKDIDPVFERHFFVSLLSWCERNCFCGKSNGWDAWSHLCDTMEALSRIRKIPWWFRTAARSLSLTRSRLVGKLLVLPYKIRRSMAA